MKVLRAPVAVEERLDSLTVSLDLSLLRHHSPIPPVVTIANPPLNQPWKRLEVIYTENHDLQLVEYSLHI